jgi:mannose-6-phosphate isomerase-like protein (cupin superfamily)
MGRTIDIDKPPVYRGDVDMLPVDRVGAERLLLGGDQITILTSGQQTGGDIFALEIRMPPGGGPPLMHRHAPSEIYYVLEGEFTFYVGEPPSSVRRITAGAGDVVPLAGNTAHTIRNESSSDAVAFVVHSPAAVMEGFSRAVAALAAHGRPTMDDMFAVAEQNGIEMLGPVPPLT